MSWVAVAIGGGAILNYLGSQNASSAMSGATNQANAISQGQYQQNRQDMLPWMQRGNAAGNMLAYLMGLPGYGPRPSRPGATVPAPNSMGGVLNGATVPTPTPIGPRGKDMGASMAYGVVNQMSPTEPGGIFDPGSGPVHTQGGGGGSMGGGAAGTYDAGGWDPSGMDPNAYGSLSRRFGMSDFQTDPGYLFRLQEGYKALQRSGAAKGLALSGAQMRALNEYGQNFASNEYGNAYNRYTNDQTNLFNRLSGIAGTGQQANQFVGSMGSNMANTVGANLMNNGAGQASNYLSQANNLSGALNQGVNMWNQNNMWQQLMSRG